MATLTAEQKITRLNNKIIKLNKEIELLQEVISDNELTPDITVLKRENEQLRQLLEEKEADFQEICDNQKTTEQESLDLIEEKVKQIEDLNQLILEKEKTNQSLEKIISDKNILINQYEKLSNEQIKLSKELTEKLFKIEKSFWFRFIKV
jgi:SMC interacting uncharacterized protein involved in chromosome segregation